MDDPTEDYGNVNLIPIVNRTLFENLMINKNFNFLFSHCLAVPQKVF